MRKIRRDKLEEKNEKNASSVEQVKTILTPEVRVKRILNPAVRGRESWRGISSYPSHSPNPCTALDTLGNNLLRGHKKVWSCHVTRGNGNGWISRIFSNSLWLPPPPSPFLGFFCFFFTKIKSNAKKIATELFRSEMTPLIRMPKKLHQFFLD